MSARYVGNSSMWSPPRTGCTKETTEKEQYSVAGHVALNGKRHILIGERDLKTDRQEKRGLDMERYKFNEEELNYIQNCMVVAAKISAYLGEQKVKELGLDDHVHIDLKVLLDTTVTFMGEQTLEYLGEGLPDEYMKQFEEYERLKQQERGESEYGCS